MNCPNCNTHNTDAARYCSNCGGELTTPTNSSEPTASPAGFGAAVAAARAVDDDVTHVRPSVSPNQRATVIASSEPCDSVPSTGNPDILIGRTIEGKYRIDAKIGAGGMGAVYQAHRLLIGDDVALKILHPEHVSQPDATERFRREAQAAARLKHPNAVSIYDFGVTNDGLVYLVMELIEGQSLREIIKQQGPLTQSAAAEVISQVCAALDEAHRQHIVHRDLKPDNIVVKPMLNGLRVKVLDFGIAKLRDLAASNLTQTGSVMGTPHYMSPEQCLGEELDSRSDIYSLGIVLYEMLAGVVPFNSPMSTAVVVQHVNQAPPPLRTINLSISPAVEAVVMHALAKQRQERPQSATALAEELRTAVSPTPSFATQQPTSTPTFATQAPSFSNSQPTVQAPTVVLRTPVSGSSTAYGASTSPLPPAYSTQPRPIKAARKPVAVFAAIGAVAAIGLAVGIYFAFFSFSAKKAVLAEVKKGNLVKPQGNSAYDLFLKHKGEDLKKEDVDEITKEVAPKLEQRGDTIINNLKTEIESEDEWTEATRAFNWLNELRPNPTTESKIYFSQGSLAFSKKDYEGALSGYKRATQLQRNWGLALNRLGRCYLNLKDKNNAREYYRQATIADPAWIYPWLNLGQISAELKDNYTAEQAFRQAISIDSQKASAHNGLGQALESQGRYCEALSEYYTTQNLIADNPTNTVRPESVAKRIAHLESIAFCGE
jgi:serine/threonine protein kinase